MMNKFLRIVLTTVSVGLALLCIAGSATSYVKLLKDGNQHKQSMAESSSTIEDLQVETMEEDPSLIFYSIEEYSAYLATLQQTSSLDNENDETDPNDLLPLNVPSNITLSSIAVNSEGTVFTYNFEIIGSNNVINFNTSDEVILELTHTIIAKQYEESFISNYSLYAQNLAACIGAGDVSHSNGNVTYTGLVYADVYNDDTNEVQRVAIGKQTVVFTPTAIGSSDGTVMYYYYPISITEREFAECANLIPSGDSQQ